MHVPLLDLKAQYKGIRDEIIPTLTEIIESQYFILGPYVEECEQAIADYSQCEYGVGVSSGTDALLIALMAENIGSGDEVITTPYTFFATAGSISRTGATPVFVDIDPITYNINPALIEEKITNQTKAIMPVHLYGQVAPMKPILDIAKRHNLVVIEDAAQAIGAEADGKRAGSFGDYGCFSFFPSKNLGAFGDGGMVVTNDTIKAERLVHLRNHGANPKYFHQFIGGNFRLDALQAAVVLIKLKSLDNWTAARQQNATRYNTLFNQTGLPSSGTIALPAVLANRHIFNQYVIRAQKRDELRKTLAKHEIGHDVYYPVPLHLQECFRNLGYQEGDFPESERAANETIALPIYPEVMDEQAEYVVETIKAYYQ